MGFYLFSQGTVTAGKEKRRQRGKRHFLPDPKTNLLPFSFLHPSLSLLLSLLMDLGPMFIVVILGLCGKVLVVKEKGREQEEEGVL